MADQILNQSDFSGGVWEGRDAPENTFLLGRNVLINDSGHPYRRGGVTYRDVGGSGAGSLVGIDFAHVATGDYVLAWDATTMYLLGLGDTLEEVTTYQPTWRPSPGQKMIVVAGIAFFISPAGVIGWAGSRKNAAYSTGTIAITANSRTVTGTGTTWTSNVDAGMILETTGGEIGVVESVDSNTQITLRAPWSTTISGAGYFLNPLTRVALVEWGGAEVACIGATADRLLIGLGDRVYFSEPGHPKQFDPAAIGGASYHEMPDGAKMIGLARVAATAAAFTTRGVVAISNLAYDAVDAAGNTQHEVSQVNNDLILADARGLAAWAGGIVVPALDDVYLFSFGSAPVPISTGIRASYREVVSAGAEFSGAAVHDGHYLMPLVDIGPCFVCRLENKAWTFMDGQAAAAAFTVEHGEEPALLGVTGARVVDCGTMFVPGAAVKADADGTAHQVAFVTRDISLGAVDQHIERLRVEYVLEDAASDNPTLTADRYLTASGTTQAITLIRGGVESDGSDRSVWAVNRKAERACFALATVGACASFTLRRVDVLVRTSGRR